MESDRAEQFAYFMIRVRRAAISSPECTLSGMVERLATGEKESFASGEELVHLVCRWPDAIGKMRDAANVHDTY